MRLADFEKTEDGNFPLFVTRVPDVGGAEEFEFRIAGPGSLVEEMLADATIELTIDSTTKEGRGRQEFISAQEDHRRAMWELAALEDIDQLLKPSPPPPERYSSVFTTIRPVSGEGTHFHADLSGVTIPFRSNLFFGGWWSDPAGFVVPSSGDQDLFIHLLAPTGPLLAASRRAGTARDTVLWLSWSPMFVWFRVFGFTGGVIGTGMFDANTSLFWQL